MTTRRCQLRASESSRKARADTSLSGPVSDARRHFSISGVPPPSRRARSGTSDAVVGDHGRASWSKHRRRGRECRSDGRRGMSIRQVKITFPAHGEELNRLGATAANRIVRARFRPFEAHPPGQAHRRDIAGHDLAPYPLRIQMFKSQGQQRGHQLTSQPAAPMRRVETPTDFGV